MLSALDLTLFRWLNSFAFANPSADAVITLFADKLAYLTVAGVILFGIFSLMPIFPRAVLARRKNFGMIVSALAAALIARFGVVALIRFFWDRGRPFEVLTNVHQLLNHDREGSFPSGHATFFFALATFVGFYYPRTSVAFFAAATAMSVSRVIAGVHWPSDIIAGALVGVLTSIVCRVLINRYRNEKTAARAGLDLR